MIKLTSILFICLFLAGFKANAQCDNFHKSIDCFKSKESTPRNFLNYSPNSHDFKIKEGKYEIIFIAHEYKVNHIIICGDKKYYPLHIVLSDISNGDIIYDNTKDDYRQYITFMPVRTRNLKLTINLLNKEIEEEVCLGFLLYKN
jgi:hypothetical protein